MTITQLEYFCAVCRYGSIAKAAEALFVSHPAVSVAIKALEKEFSLELYARTGNRVVLTEAGRAFYRKASDILQRCDDMYADFAGRPEASYRVHMGIPPIRSAVLFPDMLHAFQQEHQIPVVLHEYSSSRALEKLANGELDCCMVNFKNHSLSQFNHQVLQRDQFSFYVCSKHPLSQKKFITAKDLKEMPLILPNNDSALNHQILQAFFKENITPLTVLYSSQVLTILNFIRDGYGGAFLYHTMAAALQRYMTCLCSTDTELVCLPFRPEIQSNVVLVWPRGGYINRNVKAWLTFVKKCFQTEP